MKRENILIGRIISVLFISFCFMHNSISQNYYSEYDEITGKQNRAIFNGVLHQNIFLPTNGYHIYYIENRFTEGKVVFNNQPYQLPLKYDVLNDEIVINHINKNTITPINVTASFITKFNIFSSSFVKLKYSKELEDFYKNGFFELKYQSNNLIFYIKHFKVKYKDLSNQTVRYKFKNKSIFVIYKNGEYYRIKKKKDLKALFKKHRKVFNRYFSKEKLNTKTIIYFLKLID